MTNTANVVAVPQADDCYPVACSPFNAHLHCFKAVDLPVAGIAVKGEEGTGVHYDTWVAVDL